jgi:hypothetical protein
MIWATWTATSCTRDLSFTINSPPAGRRDFRRRRIPCTSQ